MNVNKSFKLLLSCALVMVLLVANTYGQNKVVYENYTQAAVDYLKFLKKEGGISTFTSMNQLKQQAKQLKESAIVPVSLKKAETHLLEPERMIKERKESILLIWKYFPATKTSPEKVGTYATAIVLSADGVCATNNHVFRNLIDQSYTLNPNDSLLFVSTASGKLYPIKSILTYNTVGDLALFRIDIGNDKLRPFPIGEDLEAGATVHTLTHPEDYMFFYSKGVVSRTIATDSKDPFSNRTEISADYAKGSSGGPIIDDNGNLIAMVSATKSIYYMERPQTNLQMVVKQTIPISSILRVIKTIKND